VGRAESLAVAALVRPDLFGGFGATRLALIAAHQGDSAKLRQRIAEAYARPQFAPDSMHRLLLDGLLAAVAGNSRKTAEVFSRITPQWGVGASRDVWHLWPEITEDIRQSREMRQLVSRR
jgi:hypothetical protein